MQRCHESSPAQPLRWSLCNEHPWIDPNTEISFDRCIPTTGPPPALNNSRCDLSSEDPSVHRGKHVHYICITSCAILNYYYFLAGRLGRLGCAVLVRYSTECTEQSVNTYISLHGNHEKPHLMQILCNFAFLHRVGVGRSTLCCQLCPAQFSSSRNAHLRGAWHDGLLVHEVQEF